MARCHLEYGRIKSVFTRAVITESTCHEFIKFLRTSASGLWWRELNRYHWFVFALASFGWMFDWLRQQIFTMSRSITMRDLMPAAEPLRQISSARGRRRSSFWLGHWRVDLRKMGDRWGRAKNDGPDDSGVCVCTGLSGFARQLEFFALFRFLTGAGVAASLRWAQRAARGDA